jgi:recombination protein RecT
MSQATNPPTGAPSRDLPAIRAAGKLIAKDAGGKMVRDFFELHKESIVAVLPKIMTPDRMVAVALRALRTNPKLMDCDVASLFAATISCAQLGLEPNGPQRHIYLIPFRNNKKNKTEIQIIVGYPGLIELAMRTGTFKSISSQLVYAKDTFEMEMGLDVKLRHVPYLGGDRGDILGAYAVAHFKDGGAQYEFMTTGQIDRIRDNSKAYQDALRFAAKDNKTPQTPWVQHYDEMARKTAIRRLCKWLPMSVEMAKAVAMDELGERGRAADFQQVLDDIAYSVNDTPQEEAEAGAEEETAAPAVPIPLRGGKAPAPANEATYRELLAEQPPYTVVGVADAEGVRHFFADARGDLHFAGTEEAAQANADRMRGA